MSLHSADDCSVSQQLTMSWQLRRQHASNFRVAVSSALVHVAEDTRRGFLGANAANCGIADQSLSTAALVTPVLSTGSTNPELRDVGDSFVRVRALEGIRPKRGHDVVVGLA